MKGACDQLLARPALAFHEHGKWRPGSPLDGAAEVGRRAADPEDLHRPGCRRTPPGDCRRNRGRRCGSRHREHHGRRCGIGRRGDRPSRSQRAERLAGIADRDGAFHPLVVLTRRNRLARVHRPCGDRRFDRVAGRGYRQDCLAVADEDRRSDRTQPGAHASTDLGEHRRVVVSAPGTSSGCRSRRRTRWRSVRWSRSARRARAHGDRWQRSASVPRRQLPWTDPTAMRAARAPSPAERSGRHERPDERGGRRYGGCPSAGRPQPQSTVP